MKDHEFKVSIVPLVTYAGIGANRRESIKTRPPHALEYMVLKHGKEGGGEGQRARSKESWGKD